jgi:hypothetical protein
MSWLAHSTAAPQPMLPKRKVLVHVKPFGIDHSSRETTTTTS